MSMVRTEIHSISQCFNYTLSFANFGSNLDQSNTLHLQIGAKNAKPLEGLNSMQITKIATGSTRICNLCAMSVHKHSDFQTP